MQARATICCSLCSQQPHSYSLTVPLAVSDSSDQPTLTGVLTAIMVTPQRMPLVVWHKAVPVTGFAAEVCVLDHCSGGHICYALHGLLCSLCLLPENLGG